MAYKYEDEIKEELDFISFESLGNQNEMLKELQEVYRKAKAFDNYITEVRERVRFIENSKDDIDRELQKVIDYYMEDE